MPGEWCFSSIRLERIRIAVLDPDTLAPDTGAGNGYVIDSQVLLNIGQEIEEGEEFTQKNGAGRICASLLEEDTFKRVTLQLQVCHLDPFLESVLTGARLFTDGGTPVGAQAPVSGEAQSSHVCLEAWSRAQDGTSQATPTATTPNVAYHHWVFPDAHGFVMQQVELGNGIHLFQFNGIGDENSAVTANGPFNDWPDYVADAGGVSGAYGHFLDGTTLPTADCTTDTVPAGS